MNTYEKIKKRRKELKMTQDELAKLTGYTSRTSIGKIESGLVNLPISKIHLFAKALHIDEVDLMGYNEPVDLSIDERELVELFRTLNYEGRTKVMEYSIDIASSERYKKRILLEKNA